MAFRGAHGTYLRAHPGGVGARVDTQMLVLCLFFFNLLFLLVKFRKCFITLAEIILKNKIKKKKLTYFKGGALGAIFHPEVG